jgi:hypothetical protein
MLSKRLSTMLLSGAALTGLGVSVANAGILINVQAFSKNGQTALITDPHNVSVQAGDTIVFRVFADVTGAAGNAAPDAIQSLSGSFLSNGGGNFGNLTLTAAGITAPFGASGSAAGAQTDLDGDGDLDIGSNNPGVPAGFFAMRSASLTGPRSTDAAGNSVFPAGANPTDIPNGTEYRIISNLRMVVGASAAGSTLVNYRTRVSNTGGFWSEDATEVSTDNGDGTTAFSYTGGVSHTDTTDVTGLGVTLSAGGTVPEPATLGLAGLAGLGMLARRRK